MATFQNVFKWGIISTGGIAQSFARDLDYVDDQIAFAVGSRTKAQAEAFGRQFNLDRCYGSYEELVKDPDVDGIYVATPHTFHYENTLLALHAGKPVLVEKPFTVNARQARELVDLARSKNLLLMEAMWTRFLPHIREIRAIVESGAIGEILYVSADHGQQPEVDPHSRMYAPELAGGALLDLGIYPISFAHLILGKPSRITATSTPAFTGVDAQTSAIFHYENGAHAMVTSNLLVRTPCTAVIAGMLGRIEIDSTFYCPTSYTIIMTNGQRRTFPQHYLGHGLREEAIEFAQLVRSGKTESPALTLDETIEIMDSLDEIRKQIGLRYPFE